MGRRHLIRAATIVALLLTSAVPAGAAIHWRLLADGAATGSPAPATTAYVALTRAGTAQFTSRLGSAAKTRLGHVNFSNDAVVAIFGEFGCRDSSIVVSSIEQKGAKLAVALVQEAPKPGEMQCMAIYPTYRLLLVARSLLHEPYPTRAGVTLARA